MRNAYDYPEETRLKGQKAREHILNKFSMEIVGNKIFRELIRIRQLLERINENNHEEL